MFPFSLMATKEGRRKDGTLLFITVIIFTFIEANGVIILLVYGGGIIFYLLIKIILLISLNTKAERLYQNNSVFF